MVANHLHGHAGLVQVPGLGRIGAASRRAPLRHPMEAEQQRMTRYSMTKNAEIQSPNTVCGALSCKSCDGTAFDSRPPGFFRGLSCMGVSRAGIQELRRSFS